MHRLERTYGENIPYAFKMPFHSNATGIALAVEVGFVQIGKNRNDKENYESIIWNSDLCCNLGFHTLMKHHCFVNPVQ